MPSGASSVSVICGTAAEQWWLGRVGHKAHAQERSLAYLLQNWPRTGGKGHVLGGMTGQRG